MKPSGGRSERQEEELDVLQEYVRSSDEIIAKSVQRYVGFVCRRKRVVDPTRWTLINSERGLRVYKERVELRSMKSFVSANEHDSYDVEREGRGKSATQHSAKTSREHSTGSDRRGSYIRFPSTMVSAFCIGKLRGSLDTVMAGLYADNTQDMHANCRIQFGDVLDCRVVQAFETESEAAPYGFFGVKWLEKQGHFPDVVDQLCWVEVRGSNATDCIVSFARVFLDLRCSEPTVVLCSAWVFTPFPREDDLGISYSSRCIWKPRRELVTLPHDP